MNDLTSVEPWQLYPMPPEQVAAIRQHIQRITSPSVWRVQWYSRNGIDAPEQNMGRRDFDGDDAEEKARAYYASDEVQSRVGPYWRFELQCRGPWLTVEAGDYTAEVER